MVRILPESSDLYGAHVWCSRWVSPFRFRLRLHDGPDPYMGGCMQTVIQSVVLDLVHVSLPFPSMLRCQMRIGYLWMRLTCVVETFYGILFVSLGDHRASWRDQGAAKKPDEPR